LVSSAPLAASVASFLTAYHPALVHITDVCAVVDGRLANAPPSPNLSPDASQQGSADLAVALLERLRSLVTEDGLEAARGSAHPPAPKYKSGWAAAITELLDQGWQAELQRNPDGADLIAQGRIQAMERFCADAQKIGAIADIQAKYVSQWGSKRAARELEIHLGKLQDATNAATSKDLRNQYCLEQDLIRRYVVRLRQ